MIVQVKVVEQEYEGECRPHPPAYRYWHRFKSSDGIVYHLVGAELRNLKPGQLLNVKRYPKSWIKKYEVGWGLSDDSNYIMEIEKL